MQECFCMQLVQWCKENIYRVVVVLLKVGTQADKIILGPFYLKRQGSSKLFLRLRLQGQPSKYHFFSVVVVVCAVSAKLPVMNTYQSIHILIFSHLNFSNILVLLFLNFLYLSFLYLISLYLNFLYLNFSISYFLYLIFFNILFFIPYF